MEGYLAHRKAPAVEGAFGRDGSGRLYRAIVWVGWFTFFLTLTGCAMVGPDYVKPTVPEPARWMGSGAAEIEEKDTDLSRWWTVFNDPLLNSLVESAYRQNLNLQIAGLRIL